MQRRNYKFNRGNKLHIIGPVADARARPREYARLAFPCRFIKTIKRLISGITGPSSSRWSRFIRCTYLSTSCNHSESTHDDEWTDNEDVPYSEIQSDSGQGCTLSMVPEHNRL